jgi:hypothetical protein
VGCRAEGEKSEVAHDPRAGFGAVATEKGEVGEVVVDEREWATLEVCAEPEACSPGPEPGCN